MDRKEHFTDDIRCTTAFGRTVSEPSFHFRRIFSLFTDRERQCLLDDSYNCFRVIHPGSYTLEQFVALVLVGEYTYNESGYNPEYDKLRHRWLKNVARIDVSELEDAHQVLLQAIVRGTTPRGLALVLAHTALDETFATEHDFTKLFSKAFGRRILMPEQAAAVAACVSANGRRLDVFVGGANAVVSDWKIFPKATLVGRSARLGLSKEIRELRSIVKYVRGIRTELMSSQTEIVCPNDLLDRFRIEQLSTDIFIPLNSEIVIAKSIAEAVALAERDRSALMSLSPRRFEEFMATLFSSLGFDVELTQATRDGGADLLCLKDLHGIPFRLAVEVKRYKADRPISVSLVRSFVGANEKFRANRLVYVTTSYYTQPAVDFATNYAAHLLTLRQYEQIQEWCREFLLSTPRLL